MKTNIGKKLFILFFAVLLLVTWASVARGDTEMNNFIYSGFLNFPEQIGGLTDYNHDCFISGSSLTLITGYLGLEVELMAGITWDERHDHWETTLPLLWSGNLRFYPFLQAPIAPYFKIGYGGMYTWLEFEDPYWSDYYIFSHGDFGGGVSFRGESYGNYIFFEYLRSNVFGNGAIANFHLDIFKAGYVVVF